MAENKKETAGTVSVVASKVLRINLQECTPERTFNPVQRVSILRQLDEIYSYVLKEGVDVSTVRCVEDLFNSLVLDEPE